MDYTIKEAAESLGVKENAVYRKLQRNKDFYNPYILKKDKTYITKKGLELLRNNAHKQSPSTTTQDAASLLNEIDLLKNMVMNLQNELLKEKELNKQLLLEESKEKEKEKKGFFSRFFSV